MAETFTTEPLAASQAPLPRFRLVSVAPRRMAELAKFLARDLGESEKIMAGYVRSLRENGLLPTDAGGLGHVGGALVAPEHAAVLLVAYLGSRSARGAVNGARELSTFQYQGQYSYTLDGASMPVWVSGPGDGERMGLTDWLCREIEIRLPFCGGFASTLPLIFGIECSKSHGRALVSVRGVGADMRSGADMTLRAVFSRPDEPLPDGLPVGIGVREARSIDGPVIDRLATEFFSGVSRASLAQYAGTA
jgi:hypothetical protein